MERIGIDFGTSFSTVSWVNPQTGKPEPILINGKEKIPTMLYYPPEGGEPLVGDEAYAIYEQCRTTDNQDEIDEYLGCIRSDIKRSLSKTSKAGCLPNGKVLKYVDVVADFLHYLKCKAESECFEGETVTDVCICVPVAHTEEKRDIMRKAAKKAGFSRVELLKEPVAAAMGYSASTDYKGKSVLVYDFGGGTFDVAYIRFDSQGEPDIQLPPDGDGNCGGENIDRLLYDLWDKQVKSVSGHSISGVDGIVDQAFIKTDCVHQKETFCRYFVKQNQYKAQCVINGKFYSLPVTKDEWNELISPVIDKTINITKRIVDRVKAEKLKIDKTILIGGSSKIPLVAERLAEILPAPPVAVQKVDVAVANGAAIFINQCGIPVRKCFCRRCGHELNSKIRFCPIDGVDNIRYDHRFDL